LRQCGQVENFLFIHSRIKRDFFTSQCLMCNIAARWLSAVCMTLSPNHVLGSNVLAAGKNCTNRALCAAGLRN